MLANIPQSSLFFSYTKFNFIQISTNVVLIPAKMVASVTTPMDPLNVFVQRAIQENTAVKVSIYILTLCQP